MLNNIFSWAPSTAPWWANAALTSLLAITAAWLAITFDRRKSVNQELIKKRIDVYDKMAPMLNDLFCFIRVVGHWKTLTPPNMIKNKRNLDRLIHLYGPLFSARLTTRYNGFIDTIFATYQVPGEDARLRALLQVLEFYWGSDWKSEWKACIAEPALVSSPEDIKRGYSELMDEFAVEIGARRTSWLKDRRALLRGVISRSRWSD